MPYLVTQCLCHVFTFAQLKVLADTNGLRSVEEITALTGCGSGCGLCRPYIARMLETGETEMDVLLLAANERE
jgi:bacterioferritin-associated ferredoxin